MDSQQLLDYIIKPTLEYMGGNYNSKEAQMLLLATAAIESHCGHYVAQVNGPALGIWQMEPKTLHDIYDNCDAINATGKPLLLKLDKLDLFNCNREETLEEGLVVSPMYACAMARLKYSMSPDRLPSYKDISGIYEYYKKIYNTPLGKSDFGKFGRAWIKCGLDKIELN